MDSWKECQLGDLIEVKYGKDHKKLDEGKYPCIGSGGIMRYVDSYLYDKESILIPRKGSLNNLMYREKPFWTVDTMFWSKIIDESVLPKFLFYQLTLIDYTILNVGSAVPSLTVPVISEIDVNLPPLPEQKAIAEVLSSLDDKIDLLYRHDRSLEAMAETLFRQWFVEDADESWLSFELMDLLESISIKHTFPEDKIIFLNTSDVYKGQVLINDLSDVSSLPGQAKKSIQKNDILFSEIRPKNGRWAFIDFDAINYVVSTKLMVLRSKEIIQPELIYFYLTNKSTIDELQLIAESRSGTFPQITYDNFKGFTLRFPSKSALSQAEILCKDWLSKISFNNRHIKNLTNLRDTLLPKLMSGEVRVKMN